MNIHADNYETFLDVWFELKRTYAKCLAGVHKHPTMCEVAGRRYILLNQQDLDDMIDDLGTALDQHKQANTIPSGTPYRT